MRLEAGDWVVARGAAESASPGLGKLTGGDYEAERLVRARVEFPSGVRWIAPGSLDRVPAHVEGVLLEVALDRGMIPEEVSADLRRALEQYRSGTQAFVRTPGLLDALWALLTGPISCPGLAELFELSRTALQLHALLRPPREARFSEAGFLEEEADDLEWGEEAAGDWEVEPNDAEDEDEDWDDEALAEVALGVACALLSSDWSYEDMVHRVQAALGTTADWVEGLVGRVRALRPGRPGTDPEALAHVVLEDEGFLDRWLEFGLELRVRYRVLSEPTPPAPPRFSVPGFSDEAAVATWLRIDEPDLRWLADQQLWLIRAPEGPLQHYHYHWLRKRFGGRRLVEAPKELLKSIQRRLLRRVLDQVPAHPAAHGFRRGRSVLTYASPHAGQELVLRMDLRHFFPSINAAKVAATFRAMGYAREVAMLLADLSTTRTPEAVLEGSRLGAAAKDRLRRRHLPQGAPTSPALANLCSYGLDVRLSAAAAAVSATYTRYADDLAFSGGERFRKQASRFRRLVLRIALEEGFEVHWRKNRWMRPSTQQRLAGLVVNRSPRPSRAEFDRLKAILHNCARRGPVGENREGHSDFRAHLEGRVAWHLHCDPVRGRRLASLLEQIQWPE